MIGHHMKMFATVIFIVFNPIPFIIKYKTTINIIYI